MNAKKCKKLRKLCRQAWPDKWVAYRIRPDGVIMLDKECGKGLYRQLKRLENEFRRSVGGST